MASGDCAHAKGTRKQTSISSSSDVTKHYGPYLTKPVDRGVKSTVKTSTNVRESEEERKKEVGKVES